MDHDTREWLGDAVLEELVPRLLLAAQPALPAAALYEATQRCVCNAALAAAFDAAALRLPRGGRAAGALKLKDRADRVEARVGAIALAPPSAAAAEELDATLTTILVTALPPAAPPAGPPPPQREQRRERAALVRYGTAVLALHVSLALLKQTRSAKQLTRERQRVLSNAALQAAGLDPEAARFDAGRGRHVGVLRRLLPGPGPPPPRPALLLRAELPAAHRAARRLLVSLGLLAPAAPRAPAGPPAPPRASRKRARDPLDVLDRDRRKQLRRMADHPAVAVLERLLLGAPLAVADGCDAVEPRAALQRTGDALRLPLPDPFMRMLAHCLAQCHGLRSESVTVAGGHRCVSVGGTAGGGSVLGLALDPGGSGASTGGGLRGGSGAGSGAGSGGGSGAGSGAGTSGADSGGGSGATL